MFKNGKSRTMQERYIVVNGKLEDSVNIMKQKWNSIITQIYNARLQQIDYKKKSYSKLGATILDLKPDIEEIKMNLPFYAWLYGATGCKITRNSENKMCINEDSASIIIREADKFKGISDKKPTESQINVKIQKEKVKPEPKNKIFKENKKKRQTGPGQKIFFLFLKTVVFLLVLRGT